MAFENVGKGGLWIKEGKKGKYMSGEMTFTYNQHPVTARVMIFRNDKKEGKQPDYKIVVTDSYPAKAQEKKSEVPF